MNSPFPLAQTRPVLGEGALEGAVGPVPGKGGAVRPALLCFSHLRWDFVHQRPQHLLNEAVAN
ncbi:MAG: hypothetical protein B7X99_14670, partial [Rhizobiales bacterium 17-65-6]